MSEEQNQSGYGYPYFYYPTASPAYYPSYGYRQFPPQQQLPQQQQQQQLSDQAFNFPGMLPVQQSYIENILRLNRGKEATVYMRFNSTQKVFKGRIEAAGRDHIILSDPATNKRYLLLMIYLDYVVFDEEIAYSYPFGGQSSGQVSQYPSR
ncbi:spore coat protein GerQ [Virgibacillus soli]|uniref:Spore coat protein GerQ n=1 Tax=Paracerasibacillus soli TaxID=480284 RepID=A0ABU5CT74_9BACI|nr:spore coat protein GerQ [Virgibacillus soli]MDY0409531.1 spore coat protein GerQ [Virgibacillus soli]